MARQFAIVFPAIVAPWRAPMRYAVRLPADRCYLSLMPPISSHSQQAAPSWPRRPGPRYAAAAGLSAAALIAVAACGSSNASQSGGTSLTPREALVAAVSHTQKVTSAVETLNVKVNGAQSLSTTGAVQVQLKPAVLIGANLNIVEAGKTTPIKEVLTGTAIYFSAPALTGQLSSKPWVKIPLSALKGTSAAGFGQLFHSLQSDSFTNQTELLTVAKNAHMVGRQTIDGTPTTEYAGSFKAAQALKSLPASYRSALSSELQVLGNTPISFHVWIDGQNHVRKMIETESVNGQNVTTTVNISAINQPVHVTVPPASQTAPMPGM